MESNVFGNPVTEEMVREVFPNLRPPIHPYHQAEAALMHFNADERATNVRRFVHDLKAAYGNNGTSALGMIYNGTGSDLVLVLNHSWEGSVWRNPYPRVIQNGQWAGFLHVGDGLAGPSKGAIVYRGTNDQGSSHDWLLAWNVTPTMNIQNRVYTQIGESTGSVPSWESIDATMERQTGTHHSTNMFRCYAIASTGAGSSPEFVGTMSLSGMGNSASAVATNLFGSPVTDEMVRRLFPNLTIITARNRAETALMHMYANERATNVRRFVHDLKQAYGSGTSTLGMIYNATGGSITFGLNHTWESGGNLWRTPYPRVIPNGQWFGFLHVPGTRLGLSKEAIVYRGGFNNSRNHEFMLAWNITPRVNIQNRVYTEIRVSPSFGLANWNNIDAAMESNQSLTHSSSTLGCFYTVSTGTGSSPELVGIMSLDGLAPNFMAMASDVSLISHSLDSKYDDDVVVQDREDDDADNAAHPAPAE